MFSSDQKVILAICLTLIIIAAMLLGYNINYDNKRIAAFDRCLTQNKEILDKHDPSKIVSLPYCSLR
jgi:hypothetical protein